jgi:hypothetical protein
MSRELAKHIIPQEIDRTQVVLPEDDAPEVESDSGEE